MAHAAISMFSVYYNFEKKLCMVSYMIKLIMPYGIYEDTSSWYRGNIVGNHS